MTANPIEHLWEFSVSAEKFSSLSIEQRAALGVMCFAVSETNVLQRAYLSVAHQNTGELAIDLAIGIQQLTLLRILSSKLFEAFQCISFIDPKTKKPTVTDARLKRLAQRHKHRVEELMNGKAFELARTMRNEAAFHYKVGPAKKNVTKLHENAHIGLYVHRNRGNSFYPLGEETVFTTRMVRECARLGFSDTREAVKAWSTWVINALEVLNEVVEYFISELILKQSGGNRFRKKSYWLPQELVGTAFEGKVPLFTRTNP